MSDERPRVILDTNTLVSALLKADSYPDYVIQLVLADRLVIVLSPEILAEYDQVLHRPRLDLDRRKVSRLVKELVARSMWVTPTERFELSSDPADNKFLEAAFAGEAEYLVTGNRRHFPKEFYFTEILAPRPFIEKIVLSL